MGIIKTYLLNSSFHGLPYIADNRYHWTERIFWIIMVFLSWWGAVYMMISSYDQFQNSAVSFTVDTSYLSWETKYPAIIFCEKGNKKINSFANKWFNSSEPQITEILKELVFFKGTITGVANQCVRKKDCVFLKSNLTKYAEEIRSKCKDIFSFCAWNNKEFPCCEQIMPIATIYGECYAINSLVSNEIPKNPVYMNVSHKVGLDIGNLTIEVLNPDLKIYTLSHTTVPLYSYESNLVLDGTTRTSHYKTQIDIFLGITEIVNDKDVKSTSIKRRSCRFMDENNLKHSKTYSYASCIVDCLFEFQLRKCNCIHHLMPLVDKNKICDIKGLICLTSAADYLTKELLNCFCEGSCVQKEVIFMGSVETKSYTGFYNKNSITQLNFILRAPTVRYVRNVVNGYLDLIVSLGGTAGLCVGASVLTIVEIFYYFIMRPMSDYFMKRSYPKKKIRTKLSTHCKWDYISNLISWELDETLKTVRFKDTREEYSRAKNLPNIT